MPRKKKCPRVIWVVEYNRDEKCWRIKRGKVVYGGRVKKVDAVARAAEMCNIELRDRGELSELRIRNKDGTWRTPRTYGDDPRDSKG
jgi:hypothetical protein